MPNVLQKLAWTATLVTAVGCGEKDGYLPKSDSESRARSKAPESHELSDGVDRLIEQQRNLTGEPFRGIGAALQRDIKSCVIITPYPGSPAREAGLQNADVLCAVDGTSVEGQELWEITRDILEPESAKFVRLTIKRGVAGSEEELEITVPVGTMRLILAVEQLPSGEH